MFQQNYRQVLGDLQLKHDIVAHDNFKKQDEIEKLLGLNQTLKDERENTEKDLKNAKETMEELRVDVDVCRKSLNDTEVVKLEITRMNDFIYKDNEILRNDLRKLAEEKMEFQKLISKLKTALRAKNGELEQALPGTPILDSSGGITIVID